MMVLMPVSALTNYNKVLSKIKEGNEVLLTKNGESKYAVVDVSEWQYVKSMLRFLMDMCDAGVVNKNDTRRLSEDDLLAELGYSAD
jgi:hypothetical protein